jgi:hypothetical protein
MKFLPKINEMKQVVKEEKENQKPFGVQITNTGCPVSSTFIVLPLFGGPARGECTPCVQCGKVYCGTGTSCNWKEVQ